MTSSLSSLYIVPASVLLLAFWAIWQLIRLIDLSVAVRRTLFVTLGTIALAPAIAPATITGVWVPHGLLLPMIDLNYYLLFSRFVIPSFAITATAIGSIAWWRVRPGDQPKKAGWLTVVIPVGVLGATFGLYRYSFPDHSIPQTVTMQVVEAKFGDKLDAVIALSEVQDSEQQRIEAARLESVFESDPAVLRVTYPGTMGLGQGEIFHYLRGESPPSTSCSSRPTPDQLGLMRCTWTFDTFERLDVLRYSRSMALGTEAGDVAIEFYYDEMLDAVSQ